MNVKQHTYCLPEDMKPEQLSNLARTPLRLRDAGSKTLTRTFLDTYDWRVYRAGMVVEQESANGVNRLSLWSLDGSRCEATAQVGAPVRFAQDLPRGHARALLEPVLEMRALLTLTALQVEARTREVINEDGNAVLRLVLEDARLAEPGDSGAGNSARQRCLRVVPIKGYRRIAKAVQARLAQGMDLVQCPGSELTRALDAVGRVPQDYSSKFELHLEPDMRADVAVKLILRELLASVRANEPGVRESLDTEFLHDFRVAVRRARSALAQIKGVFPAQTVAGLRGDLAWLGKQTNVARDIDVYLLDYGSYLAHLPAALRPHLDPLRDFLARRQQQAYAELTRLLDSAAYRRVTQAWQAFADDPPPPAPTAPEALTPVSSLARKRIWRTYRRVMKEGGAITADSPAEALHELRITCKKLRYLMEFFRSLYPPKSIGKLIKALKAFQDNLGEFQDLQVQQESLLRFGAEMREEQGLPPETEPAMEHLVIALGTRQGQMRREFHERFTAFSAVTVVTQFRDLFGAGKRRKRGKKKAARRR
jgi:CHAD domain-containing protein